MCGCGPAPPVSCGRSILVGLVDHFCAAGALLDRVDRIEARLLARHRLGRGHDLAVAADELPPELTAFGLANHETHDETSSAWTWLVLGPASATVDENHLHPVT